MGRGDQFEIFIKYICNTFGHLVWQEITIDTEHDRWWGTSNLNKINTFNTQIEDTDLWFVFIKINGYIFRDGRMDRDITKWFGSDKYRPDNIWLIILGSVDFHNFLMDFINHTYFIIIHIYQIEIYSFAMMHFRACWNKVPICFFVERDLIG